MAKFLLLHSYDPRMGTSEAQASTMKAVVNSFTKDTYCIASWVASGAGKIACLWEAPSEQAIIDVTAKGADIPVEGIYPAMVIEWAEVKKTMKGR
jgi:phage-related protein